MTTNGRPPFSRRPSTGFRSDLRAEALCRLAVVRLYTEGYFETTRVLQQALSDAGDDSPLRVQILITLAYSLMHHNEIEEGKATAERAVADAERLGQPHLLSLALGMRVTLGFMAGEGLDDVRLARALELEDQQTVTPLVFRPSVQNALLLEWTGELDRAQEALEAIRLRCMEKGEEGEYVFIAQHVVMSAIWRGDFVNASLVAEDSMERALQLGGDTPLFLAHGMRAPLAAFAGHEAETRRTIDEALEIGRRTGTFRLGERLLGTLAFLEVSLGNYDAAVAAVAPMLSAFDPESTPTELPGAAFLPDAIEALVQLGRLADAEPLIAALERNGRTFDRAWMRAVGARCRAMLLAARGDLDGAHESARRAMGRTRAGGNAVRHCENPPPAGTTRTATAQEGVGVGQPARGAGSFRAVARSALGGPGSRRTGPREGRTGSTGQLTPSEQRVAELAASGMKNRDVANALFISPKTVEANLARIYRKLGIKSRAELGRHIGRG